MEFKFKNIKFNKTQNLLNNRHCLRLFLILFLFLNKFKLELFYCEKFVLHI